MSIGNIIKTTISFVLCYIISIEAVSVTCRSIQDGDWEAASTWDCGMVPDNSVDTIIVSTDDTVTIFNPNLAYDSVMYIVLDSGSALEFDGGKLNLPSGSQIVINEDASLFGSSGGNNDKIRIGGNGVWSGNDGEQFGPLIIDENGIFPVVFLSFGVKSAKNSTCNIVSWSTVYEKESQKFVVQRSINGTTFEDIGSLDSKNQGIGVEKYEYRDYDIQGITSNYVYYRIKQLDEDGSISFTSVQKTVASKKLYVDIYPNPISSGATLNIATKGFVDQEKVKILILDIYGREIQAGEIIKSDLKITFLEPLRSGKYFVQLVNKNINITKPLIVR